MPANSRTIRVLLFSVLCLFVVGFAPGQARRQVADKGTQSASAPSSEGSSGRSATQPVSAEGER